jgi:hypothetical protein
MHRRTVLASGGVGLASLFGGCSAVGTVVDESPSVPSGMSTEELHVVDDVLPESGQRRTPGYKETVSRVFTEGEGANQDISSDEVPTSFLAETDFGESFLVVVQYGRQSATWLELDRIERTNGGLDIVVDVGEPSGGYGDDLATHSLLLRITDRRAGVPDHVSAIVHDA